MPEDRRNANRTRLSGLRATYESADGLSQNAEVFNLSSAGLFLETETQIPVGKRLSLEVHVTGEPSPWPALGRVVWTRPSQESAERPRGMGVKLIDVEDAVIHAIERLVDGREHTEPGLGVEAFGDERERTILGVGSAAVVEVPVPAASEPFVTPLLTPLLPPVVDDDPSASRIHAANGNDRDAGLPLDFAPRSESVHQAAPLPAPVVVSLRTSAAALTPARIPLPIGVPISEPAAGPRGRGWIVAGVVMLAIAMAAYALRNFLQTAG